jgi:hypothetical protein
MAAKHSSPVVTVVNYDAIGIVAAEVGTKG